ncbi:MAG: transcriptional regulator [Magnetococcales bacterium]|nr:transcriptional regulator [Magnetococcales bacterium]|tara:strand:+ start:23246 stop:23440 length:195 start_codon:yes stop_codon:yes gene_type:complete
MTNNNIGLIRLPEVLDILQISKSTWWKMVSEGKAPKPVKLSVRCAAWRVKDIQEFVDNLGGDDE